MNIYDQLQAVEDRYEELGELLSDPEVVSDTKRFMELSREEANTRETVTAYRSVNSLTLIATSLDREAFSVSPRSGESYRLRYILLLYTSIC